MRKFSVLSAAACVIFMTSGCFMPSSMQVAPANLVTGSNVQAAGGHVETRVSGLTILTIPITKVDVIGTIKAQSGGRPITNLQVNYWNWFFPLYAIFGWDYAKIEFDYVQ